MQRDWNFAHSGPSTAPLTGALLAGLGAVCATSGAVSLIDAAGGAQERLTLLYQIHGEPTGCGPLTVPGWGTDFVLGALALALIMIALAILAALGILRWGSWGEAPFLLSTLPIFAMWLDAYIVSKANLGDCDGIGLVGMASAAIDRAGWLLVAAMVLCFVSWAVIASIRRSTYPVAQSSPSPRAG